MERPNSQQLESNIHCQGLVVYADDQSSTNLYDATKHCIEQSPVESPTNFGYITSVHGHSATLTNTQSLQSPDS